MNTESQLLSRHSRGISCGIAIAATYTAEPVEEVLAFWMSELRPCAAGLNSPPTSKYFNS